MDASTASEPNDSASTESRVLRALSYFIPPGDRDRIEVIRMRLYVVFAVLVAANAGLFAYLHYVHHLPGTSYLVVHVLVVICSLSLTFPLLLRARIPFRVLGPAFMMFFEVSLFAIAWADGGLQSGAVFWMAVLPLAAACVGGAGLGTLTAVASTVSGAVLYGLGLAGHEFVQSLSIEDASLHYVLNFANAAVLVGVLSALYEGPIIRQLRGELEARKEAQDRAEAASRSKTALLANMSHEFRTPLTAVLTGAEILRMEANDEDAPVLESMTRGAQRLLATLEGVIDLTRLDGDRLTTTRPVDVVPAVRSAVSPYAAAAIRKGLSFEVRGESALALADPDALGRVASVLVDNAIRFTERGGIEVAFGVEGNRAVVTVADTGIGMTAAFASRAAEPFCRPRRGTRVRTRAWGSGSRLLPVWSRRWAARSRSPARSDRGRRLASSFRPRGRRLRPRFTPSRAACAGDACGLETHLLAPPLNPCRRVSRLERPVLRDACPL